MAGAIVRAMVTAGVLACCAVTLFAQGTAVAPAPAQKEAVPSDPVGRHSPRGTVLGFLDAARSGDDARAAQFLDAQGPGAETLAHQLFLVLDARLQARLLRISDAPEGSLETGRLPTQEVVGTIDSRTGLREIVLERVTRGGEPPVWLFSRATLAAVPALHEEIITTTQTFVPGALLETKLGDFRLFDLIVVILGLPAMYLVTLLLNRVLTALARRAFKGSGIIRGNVLPLPARLLLVTVMARLLIASLPLSLAVRQLLANAASLVIIVTVAWLLFLSNAEAERHLQQRIEPASVTAASSLLRLLRRGVDVLICFGAIVAALRQLGVDPTPALAGLGVGGIAVALAAQKTLENVIAGASLIFDKAVRVGDFIKMGEIIGTVDHIGLRSTRIRTLDRTIVSVPNSQIASASVETISARDKFWFHPIVSLRYETTTEQLRQIIDGITGLLAAQASVDRESVRVRFLRLASVSLDIEVFAYLYARDWNHFLELQEPLLVAVTGIVSRAGAAIAFPAHTMYVTTETPHLAPATALRSR
jgi:MscS family membrane protein